MRDRSHRVSDTREHVAEGLDESFPSANPEAKPVLRGWLHMLAAPATLAAGAFLIAIPALRSPSPWPTVGNSVFVATGFALFTISSIYHRGRWQPKVQVVLKRLDHANIFLLIAGSYTPFTIILLHGRPKAILLSLVWGGALLGMAFRMLWTAAPRWLYVPIYLALGWAAIFFLGDFYASASTPVFVLLVVGGGLYTLGGIVYGVKWPNPAPRWFGFHEVFHLFTLGGYITHAVAIAMAAWALG